MGTVVGRRAPLGVPSNLRTTVRAFAGRMAFYVASVLLAAFFAVPMVWIVVAPFDAHPTFVATINHPTLVNFADVFKNPDVVSSLRNSIILALGAMILVVVFGAMAAYALSRVKIRGRDIFLYILLLFSSIATGTAAIVPLFLLVFDLHLINSLDGVILVLAGGLLPTAIFILKDFMDTTPTSYEESARVFGATPLQVLRDIVAPLVRPGMAVVAVWAIVNVWGNFLTPFILLRNPSLSPAAVELYSFYTSGGAANLRLLSTFALLFSLPVVIMYLLVQHRYGFRFYGGIKH